MENEEIIKRFDMIFCTETKESYIREMPVLMKIFNKLGEDLYIFDDGYEKIRKEKIAIESKLVQTFSKEEDKLYNELWDLDNRMVAQREMQMFIYGFLVAKHLEKEKEK